MSEDQGRYDTEAETAEALKMLGTGYEHPSVVVEAPQVITTRRNGKMIEEETPAWVKFSTEFKEELADLNEYSLKVFIYIGLSVNFKTGTAYPGIRKIAKDTKMDKDTVAKAVADLEEKGFLSIQKRDGNSNVYKPVRFISIGKGVRSEGTPSAEPSGENDELSDENAKPSGDSRVNETQLDKQELNKKINKTVLEVFIGYFGKFFSERELKRWEALYEAVGKDQVEELAAWAFKKEIHMTNRGGLLDSLETAAKNWRGKAEQKTPEVVNRPEYRKVTSDDDADKNYIPNPFPRPRILAR